MKKLNSILLSTLIICTLLISCTEDEPAIDITDVKFTDGAVEVTEGLTYNLDDILEVVGTDADQAQITFNSADPTIVSVDGTTLTAEKVGSTTVTATEAQSELTASVEVTVVANVVAVTGITLDKETADLKIGETLQLSATIAPEDATEKGLTWSVAFPSEGKINEVVPTDIATVSEVGLVTAVSAGDVVVTVTTTDGSFTASVELSVTNINVTGVSISPDPITLTGNEAVQLVAAVTPENATDKTVTWSIELEASDAARTNIAAVGADFYAEINEVTGEIKGKKACDGCGLMAVATATDGELSAKLPVKVVYVAVESLTLDPAGDFDVVVGETKQMAYTIVPTNATNQTIAWSITSVDLLCGDARTLAVAPSLDNYATIGEEGLVTAVMPYNVLCSDLAVSASVEDLGSPAIANFFVVQLATSIEIRDSDGYPYADKMVELNGCDNQHQLYTSVLPANTSDKSVTWSVTDGSGISVNSSGLLEFGFAGGDATITVMTNDGTGLSDSIHVIVTNCEP